MSSVTSLNRKISIELSFTPYASLLLSAFPDSVLAELYEYYKVRKQHVKHPVTWMFSAAREICKKREIDPDYSQMLKEVKASGYGKGDKLLLYSDKDSQFRYDDPASLKQLRRTSPKPIVGMIKPSGYAKPKHNITVDEEREALERLQAIDSRNPMIAFIKGLARSKPERFDHE